MRGLLLLLVSLLGAGVASAQSSSPGIPVNCVVEVSTATTLTAVGGQCAASATVDGLALYITDILFSTNAGAIAADSFNTLKYGTGSACATGTVIFWLAMNTAAVQTVTPQSLRIPLRVPPGRDVCWINSTAGSKAIVLSGYRAP